MKPRAVPTWHEYFMAIAKAVATRSKDPHRQTGCVIVNPALRIIATGYNGAPSGAADDTLNWDRPDKYDFMLHAELNALLHPVGYVNDATLYVTGPPCAECLKAVAAAGIEYVYWLDEPMRMADGDYMAKAAYVAHVAGINLRRMQP